MIRMGLGINSKILLLSVVFILLFGIVGAHATEANKKEVVEQFIVDSCIVDSRGTTNLSNNIVKQYVSVTADATYTQSVVLKDGTTTVFYDPSTLDLIYRQVDKLVQNTKVGEKIGDLTEGLEFEADTMGASTILSGFRPLINLAVGLIVVLIIAGMMLFTSTDVCYIAFPLVREKAEVARQSGGRFMTSKTSGGDVQVRWITDDARYAVEQGTIDSGRSPWGIYFKKRLASYIFLAIILYIFLTGNISIITDLAVTISAGIMKTLMMLRG